MNMTPRLARLALTAHTTFSVGWLGAVAAYLALAVAGLTATNPLTVQGTYASMELIGWFVIVPFSIAAMLTGLLQSLGTRWGLFRHWWVLAKFVLTTAGTVVLLQHMEAVTRMSAAAAATTLAAADLRPLRIQLVVHAVGGLLILIAATTLSVYKPWGLTPYGRRITSQPDPPPRRHLTAPIDAAPARSHVRRNPRWVNVVAIHAVGLAVLFVIVHLAGGGLRGH
jgi:hypothetical protein